MVGSAVMTGLAEEKIAASAGQDSTRAFSIQIVIGLVVVSIVSFAAFIVLSAFADDLRQPEDGGPHALSKSAIGFAGMVDLLQSEGWRVRVSRGSLRELKGVDQLTILSPVWRGDLDEGVLYRTWGDILVVLPKWDVQRDWNHPGWVIGDGGLESEVEKMLDKEGLTLTVGNAPGVKDVVLKHKYGAAADIPAGRIERLQTLSSADIEPVLTDENGHTVLGRISRQYADYEAPTAPDDPDAISDPDRDEPAPPHEASHESLPHKFQSYGQRDIFVLAEPDLLNTKGLASAITARAGIEALRTISEGDDTEIVFDLTLHGMERSRNFLKLLLQPPFLPAVLCLAFAGALMAVYAVAGRMRVRSGREIALGKTMLVENSALLLSLAGRDSRMGKRYVQMTRALAAAAAGVPSRSSEAQQVAMLDAVGRGEKTGAAYSQLADELAKSTSSSTMLQAANRLFRWRQEIGREHRRR
jgi:hypothetical protein